MDGNAPEELGKQASELTGTIQPFGARALANGGRAPPAGKTQAEIEAERLRAEEVQRQKELVKQQKIEERKRQKLLPLPQAQVYSKNLPADITSAKKQVTKAKSETLLREVMREEYIQMFKDHVEKLQGHRDTIENGLATETISLEQITAAKAAVSAFRLDKDAFTKALDVYHTKNK